MADLLAVRFTTIPTRTSSSNCRINWRYSSSLSYETTPRASFTHRCGSNIETASYHIHPPIKFLHKKRIAMSTRATRSSSYPTRHPRQQARTIWSSSWTRHCMARLKQIWLLNAGHAATTKASWSRLSQSGLLHSIALDWAKFTSLQAYSENGALFEPIRLVRYWKRWTRFRRKTRLERTRYTILSPNLLEQATSPCHSTFNGLLRVEAATTPRMLIRKREDRKSVV